MNIRLKTLLYLCFGIVILASCSSDDDSDAEYYNWKARNEAFFSGIYDKALAEINAGATDWVLIPSISKNDMSKKENYIVVRILEQRDRHDETTASDERPLPNRDYGLTPGENDECKVTYRGNLMPSDSYKTTAEPDKAEVGFLYEAKWYGNDFNPLTAQFVSFKPTTSSTSNLIEGFGTALQYMHPGDRWRVYIPQQLGYGSKEKTGIPAYSTLIFDLYLKEFTTHQKN